jgi:hypothetical protein
MIESWPEPPLFSLDRKKSLDQNEVNNTLNARTALVTQQSQAISQLVKSSLDNLTHKLVLCLESCAQCTRTNNIFPIQIPLATYIDRREQIVD